MELSLLQNNAKITMEVLLQETVVMQLALLKLGTPVSIQEIFQCVLLFVEMAKSKEQRCVMMDRMTELDVQSAV